MGGGYCVGLGIDLDRSETPRTMNATYAEETKISYKWENNSQHKNPELNHPPPSRRIGRGGVSFLVWFFLFLFLENCISLIS